MRIVKSASMLKMIYCAVRHSPNCYCQCLSLVASLVRRYSLFSLHCCRYCCCWCYFGCCGCCYCCHSSLWPISGDRRIWTWPYFECWDPANRLGWHRIVMQLIYYRWTWPVTWPASMGWSLCICDWSDGGFVGMSRCTFHIGMVAHLDGSPDALLIDSNPRISICIYHMRMAFLPYGHANVVANSQLVQTADRNAHTTQREKKREKRFQACLIRWYCSIISRFL